MEMEEIKRLGECELLCQLAEEAAELSQAALKLRRAIDGRNPTQKTVYQCRDELIEEIADCELIMRYLGLINSDAVGKKYEIMTYKESRWKQRLSEMNQKDGENRGGCEMDQDNN